MNVKAHTVFYDFRFLGLLRCLSRSRWLPFCFFLCCSSPLLFPVLFVPRAVIFSVVVLLLALLLIPVLLDPGAVAGAVGSRCCCWCCCGSAGGPVADPGAVGARCGCCCCWIPVLFLLVLPVRLLSRIHISEPMRLLMSAHAVCWLHKE